MKFGPPETQVIGRFSLDAPATALSALKRERERESGDRRREGEEIVGAARNRERRDSAPARH